jgi:hypothetical protein
MTTALHARCSWAIPLPTKSPALQQNASSSLSSDSFHQAQTAFELRKAATVTVETDIHPPNLVPDMVPPHRCLFQDDDVTSVTVVAGVTIQGYQPKVPHQVVSGDLPYLSRAYPCVKGGICEAYPSLDTRLAHISSTQYIDIRKPFDLHHKITIRDQPNAFGPQNNITYPGGLHVSTQDVSILEVNSRPAYTLFPGILSCVPMRKES